MGRGNFFNINPGILRKESFLKKWFTLKLFVNNA